MTAVPRTRVEHYRKGRRCANCDARVGDRGPESASGEYFCPAPDCRAIRDARRQARRRGPSWKETARKVALEIDAERERDAPLVEKLRAGGLTDHEIRREFPFLRL